MEVTNSDLLQLIENLTIKMQSLSKSSQNENSENNIEYTLKCLAALTGAVTKKDPVFGTEPWHAINDEAPLSSPGEYLLRLKDSNGKALPPYPAIMAFYENNLAADIDTILFLCALRQFKNSDEQQISVNASARSLRDTNFIKTVLSKLEDMDLKSGKKIIIEIHESTPNLTMSPKALELFRKFDITFAIDDIGLSMNDVFRLSEFENIANFIKLDKSCVRSNPENPNSLDQVMSLISATFSEIYIIAEGVKTPQHALEIHQHHPGISYVQGMHLPDRKTFLKQWNEIPL